MIQKRLKKYAENVSDIIQDRSPLTFTLRQKVPHIIRKMNSNGTGAGGVIDSSGRFIGFVTEREISRKVFGGVLDLKERLDALLNNKSSDDLTVWDVMIANPDTLHPKDTVEDALEAMMDYGYRYMPVTSDRERLTGIMDVNELHQQIHAKTRAIMESKDSLLSYFTHAELYGGAGGYVPPRTA